MSLRVISGSAKGRKLKSVPGATTRPVMDRVKEALFNIIGGDLNGTRWWDLFAGTGAIGIEALSRGAAFARFSDLNPKPIETIKWNIGQCGFQDRSEILRGDALALLSGRIDRTFEYIYIAPPQYKGLWNLALNALDGHPEWLRTDGWVIVQIDPKEYTQVEGISMEEFDQRRYGNTLLVFLRLK